MHVSAVVYIVGGEIGVHGALLKRRLSGIILIWPGAGVGILDLLARMRLDVTLLLELITAIVRILNERRRGTLTRRRLILLTGNVICKL